MKSLFNMIYFRWMGWQTDIRVPYRKKSIICVAPHTSNRDFLVGLVFSRAIGLKAGFLMKRSWFFFPLGSVLKALGGIPVERSRHNHLTDRLADILRSIDELNLAITPEGTRSRNSRWKRGFYFVALKTGVPIQLYTIDYRHKVVACHKEIVPTGDIAADYKAITAYYAPLKPCARFPKKFCVDETF